MHWLTVYAFAFLKCEAAKKNLFSLISSRRQKKYICRLARYFIAEEVDAG
jgi:hypothetical protein